MYSSQEWYNSGSSANAGGDPGDPIRQSLRWRTNTNQFELDGAQPSAVGADWTVSFWIKLSCSNADDMIWSTDQNNSYSYFSWQTSSGKFGYDGSNTGNGVYRDPSAWYHIVMTPENSWVNGVLDYTGNIMPNVATNTGGHQIGYWSSGWTGSHYLAEFHFIQGQRLEPTTFGRVNANGVWVPVDPKKDGDTSWYGVNGYHLTFDPSDVGKDYSGNGNHFTATGFDVSSTVSGYWVDNAPQAVNGEVPNSQGQTYWTDIVPDNAYLYFTGYGVPNISGAFDGGLSGDNFCLWAGTYQSSGPSQAFFDLRDYAQVDSVAIWSSNYDGAYVGYDVELCDASKTVIAGTKATTPQGTAIAKTNIPVAGAPRYIKFTAPGGTSTRMNFYGIEVNGQILSQSAVTAPTYDLMQDSPTNNFATFNPLYRQNFSTPAQANGIAKYLNANLTTEGLSTYVWCWAFSTIKLPPKTYWEIYVNSTFSSYPYVGVSLMNERDQNSSKIIQWYSGSVAASFDSVTTEIKPFPTFAAGDTLRIWYDQDQNIFYGAVNGGPTSTFDVNAVNSVNGIQPDDDVYAFVNNGNEGTKSTVSVNFGQQPFKYTPPAGFEPLSTANMPASTIADGRDHFQAITGPGQGAVTSVITSVGDGFNSVQTQYNTAGTFAHTVADDTLVSTVQITAAGGGGGGATGGQLTCRYEVGDSDRSTYCAYTGDSGLSTTYYVFSFTPAEYGSSATIRVGAGGSGGYGIGLINDLSQYQSACAPGGSGQATVITPSGTGLVGQTASGQGGRSTVKSCGNDESQYTACGVTPTYGARPVAQTPSNFSAALDSSFGTISGASGGTGPGNYISDERFYTVSGNAAPSGRATVVEYYPSTSGVGDPTGYVNLTFTDNTGFSDIRVGQQCQNLDGTVTGEIVVIDTGTNTISVETSTGTWSQGDQLITVSGEGLGLLIQAQTLFPNGLWWIKDRVNANQHQLVDSVRGNNALTTPSAGVKDAYVAPAGDSVAWCWNAPDVWSPDGSGGDNGTIVATGRRNQDAGFSLFEYTGTGADSTLAHGLGVQPSMIFIKNHNVAAGSNGSWVVKFPKINPENVNEMLRLNGTGAVYTPSIDRFTQQPDNQFIYLTGDGQVNSNPNDYSMYCWSEIPGYSAFGSYTGNGNADGPFVYLGFKPSLIMIKCITIAYNWGMFASPVKAHNPVDSVVYPNTTGAANKSSYNNIDFLSNGFKLRTSYSYWNYSNARFIYCAWAENPFQEPATAR